MAEGDIINQVGSQMPRISTTQAVDFIWYVIIGCIAGGIVLFILYQIWKSIVYKYHVEIWEKIGDTEINYKDTARLVQVNDNFLFHFRKLNKYSPVFDKKYFRVFKLSRFFGLSNTSKQGFCAYLYGESLFPMEVHKNPGLQPINLDLFNYMQTRIKMNHQKYENQNMLLKLAPIIGVGLVVVMFIVGMIFYTKHIEIMGDKILSATTEGARAIIEAQKNTQVIIPQGG